MSLTFITKFIEDYCKTHNVDKEDVIRELKKTNTSKIPSFVNIKIEKFTDDVYKLDGVIEDIEPLLTMCSFNTEYECWLVSKENKVILIDTLKKQKIKYEEIRWSPQITSKITSDIPNKIKYAAKIPDTKFILFTKVKKGLSVIRKLQDKCEISVHGNFYICEEQNRKLIESNMTKNKVIFNILKYYKGNKYREEKTDYIFERRKNKFIVVGVLADDDDEGFAEFNLSMSDIELIKEHGWEYDEDQIDE